MISNISPPVEDFDAVTFDYSFELIQLVRDKFGKRFPTRQPLGAVLLQGQPIRHKKLPEEEPVVRKYNKLLP